MAYLRLVRFPNLLIVALTQGLVYYRLIDPALRRAGVTPVFDAWHVGCLITVTMLITACGYIVNDVFDHEIDRVNRPQRLIIGRSISFQAAYRLIFCLTTAGFLLALYLALYVEKRYLLFLYPLALGGLYLYSARLKREALLGNLLIALYCAGSAAVIWLAEAPALGELARRQPAAAAWVWTLFVWYLAFAFLITVFRELIKDIEDVRGDRAGDCRTAPIRWGEPVARLLAFAFGGGLLLFLAYHGCLYHRQFGGVAVTYLALAVGAPLAAALLSLRRARDERAYRRVSQLAKMIILTGLLLMLFVRA